MPTIEIPPVDWRVVAQLLIVFGWASALLMVDLFVRSKRVTGYLALIGLVVAAGAGAALWGIDAETFSGKIRLDNYALTLNWIFFLTAAISIVIALDYLPRQGIERGEFYALVLFAVAGMMLLAQGTDLIVLFLGLELLSITLYVLIGFAYRRLSSEEAGLKYLLVGAFAGGFVVFGIALLYGATGTSNLREIGDFLRREPLAGESYTYLLAGAALFLVGFGYKVAMAPFHMWTPDVYEGAPTPVAAFMSVGSKAAGFAAMLRFLLEALDTQRAVWVPALAVLAALTMVVGNVGAIQQRNVKRMLGYSSIGQAGFILLGVLAPSERGVEGLLFYLLAYTLSNLGAFAALIALEQRGEAAWDMSDFGGLYARRPLLAVAMAICLLSLAGVPPTAGFWGKFYVFTAAWSPGLEWLVLLGVVVSAVAAFYYLRVAAQMFMSEPAREVQLATDPALRVGIAVAAVAVVLLGLLPAPAFDLVQQSVLAVAGR